ncbi:MAG TPA: lasso peptide biosynthesis B2 protein [Pyrinomonadaceae bacterium]|nr:lasso peptide biosynthesis B2 protein [Pyrinomonadaceae bacterium]
MALWVVLISVLAELTSLSRAQRIAAFKVRSTSVENGSETPAKLGQTIDSLLGINLFVFRRSCWKRAMVLHRYLALNGIESQIKFGLRKESNGKVDGHAWLEHHGQPLLEDNAANYVVTFSLPAEYSLSGHSATYQ